MSSLHTKHAIYFFIIINVGVRANLHTPRLILQTLKLTIM